MRNKYYGLRHGQSTANVLGIVVSHLENGVKEEYSLTSLGKHQVASTVTIWRDGGALSCDTLIYYSPFSRCRVSAEIAQKILGVPEIVAESGLMERNFGEMELGPGRYEDVWTLDSRNPDHQTFGVESARKVQKRMTSLIMALEAQHQDKKILLVSHGDPLDILRVSFCHISPGHHKTFLPFGTGDLFPFPRLIYWDWG